MNKKVIFTISTGRNGTKYLSELFRMSSHDVVSFHEQDTMSSYFKKINCNNDILLAKQYIDEVKVPWINSQLKDYSFYVETNHLLCKGFLERLLEVFPNAILIYLYREFIDVSKSMYLHQTIPKNENVNLRKVRNYFRFPSDKMSFFKLDAISNLSDFEYCLWYNFEILKIYQFFKCHHRYVYKVNLEELNNMTNVLSFFNMLGISNINIDDLQKVVNKPLNVGVIDKNKFQLTDNEISYSVQKILKLYFKTL